ncbi:MAG: OmpH family outer membrane protein [Muribaculaceae bacterium]|nr:OmpH family outer membrane protein [Muribaculaceae bacterium]MDE6486395.1 OmpH family outer membrane protein [Muribaculaceae bacterium]
MIKRLILAVLVALPFSALAQKFGVVDLDNVFQAMPETASAQTQLTDASKKYEDEFQKLREEVDKLFAEYQNLQKDPATPDAIKERRLNELTERDQKVQQFRNTASQDLARLQEQLMAPIQQKIGDAVKAVGQEGGFTFIFPNEQGLLLYTGTDVTDVTALVKTKLGIK